MLSIAMNFAKIVSLVPLIVFEAHSKLDEASFSALQDLYQSTNGENWIQNDNWTFAEQNITANDICPDNRPFGIGCFCINSCDNDTFIVSQIQLSNNNLVGTIPSSIFSIFFRSFIPYSGPQSVYLNMENNSLTGSIPNILVGNNETCFLNDLLLSNNQLSGTIPLWLTYCNWFDIEVSNNSLIGTLPSNWTIQPAPGLSPRQQNVYFDNNKLTGTISTQFFANIVFVNIPKIALKLNSNQLYGSIPHQLVYPALSLDASFNKSIYSIFYKKIQN